MVGGFEVGLDLVECEPRGFEFSASIERGLVHVVFTLRITAGAECVNRECTDLGAKLNDTDVRSTCNTVTAFLSTFGRSIKREHCTVITVHAANSQARLCITEIFVFAFVNPLQTRELAP